MPIPLASTKHYEKNRLDLEVERFAALDNPGIADLNRVGTIAQIQQDIDKQMLAKFRRKGLQMDNNQRKSEKHYSGRLAKQLEYAGYPRPSPRCDAHAMVSGNHQLAAQIRAVIYWCRMRIDDYHNGCWLPRSKADKPYMPTFLKNAIPHQNIHTKSYYRWIRTFININTIRNLEDLVKALRQIRWRLQSGTLRPDVLKA